MSDSIYKVVEVVGSSAESWEEAAKKAIERASQTLRNLRVAEVIDQDIKIEDGKAVNFRTKVRLSFKFED
jgi:flavin-binding protein dodecin